MLRPGGAMAVTVPRCGPEIVNWSLSDGYHSEPGGHIRIYRRSTLWRRLARDRPRGRSASHHAHGLHSPYWWLQVPGRRRRTTRAGPSPPTTACLVWDIVEGAPIDAPAGPGAQPAHRQEPRRLPAQAPGAADAGAARARARRTGRRHDRADPDRRRPAHGGHPRGPRRARRRPTCWPRRRRIAEVQRPDGMIPWFEGGHCDPWNHVESAMALSGVRPRRRGRARLRMAGRAPARPTAAGSTTTWPTA